MRRMLMFWELFWLLQTFDGNVSVSLPHNPYFQEMSEGGEKLVIDFYTARELFILRNTGSTYEVSQTMPFAPAAPPQGCTKLSSDGSRIVHADSASLIVYALQHSLYTAAQTIPLPSNIKRFKLSTAKLAASVQSGHVYIYEYQNNSYQLTQTINDGNTGIAAIVWSEDEQLLMYAGSDNIVKVWNTTETLSSMQNISLGIRVRTFALSSTRLIIITQNNIHNYNRTTHYNLYQNLSVGTSLYRGGFANRLEDIWVVDNQKTLFHYQLQNQLFVLVGSEVYLAHLFDVAVSADAAYCSLSVFNSSIFVKYSCPQQCATCVFPNNCTSCADGYELVDGVCEVPAPATPTPMNASQCVGDEWESKVVCSEYCSRECGTCWDVKDDCASCAEFYTMDGSGECVIENEVLNIMNKCRPFFNFIRRGAFKYLFLLLDDLWLYEYHYTEYKGILKVIFSTIRFVEDKQWQIIGLDSYRAQIENSAQKDKYNIYSNVKYMEIERKNNELMVNTAAFFTFFVPFIVVFLFLVNRLFYLMFNFEVSKYIRPYSFWGGTWLELLVGNNVELFTFLAFRSFDIPFRLDYSDKWVLVLAILMFFLVCVFAIAAYPLFYWHYGKLGRYFLVNMFRFPSSYWLMAVLYGFRPLLKGAFHASLYNSPVLQISCLMTVEALALLTLLFFQFVAGNHKSFFTMFFEVMNSGSLIILNILILLKYHYYKSNEEVRVLVEECIVVIVWCSIAFTLLRVLIGLLPECEASSSEFQSSMKEEMKQREKDEKDGQDDGKKQQIVVMTKVSEGKIQEEIDEIIANHYLKKIENTFASPIGKEEIKQKFK